MPSGRRWSTQRTAAHGHRRLHERPGPQRSDRSLRRSAGDSHPTLGLPVLAEVSRDAVDASTLRFLIAAARLAQRQQRLQQLREEDQKFDSGYLLLPVYSLFGYCFRLQRNAWSSVVHALRQSRSWRISTCLRGNRPRILRSILFATADSQLQLYNKVVHIPVMTQWPFLLVQPVWLTTEILQLHLNTVIDVPVVQVVLFFPGR